jgi:predicted TIM-barrel fold metal-dependent hydrolase
MSEIFRRHVWVAPYPEDDVPRLLGLLGAERVLFGSDFPHPEGLKQPLDFEGLMPGVDPAARARVMRANAAELLGLN